MPKIKISKDTQLFVSIAQHPSNFGTTLFNAAFAFRGIDAVYKTLQVDPGDLKDAIAGIRALGINGCGVSMPFKTEVLQYLDSVDAKAKEIGAVNTIVKTSRGLKGYNTDYLGAKAQLARISGLRGKSVVMLGSGGVAQAIAAALRSLEVKQVTVVAKDERQGRALARKWSLGTVIPWSKRNNIEGDVLINATPIGMAAVAQELPVAEDVIDRFTIGMDVVINPLETTLMKLFKQHGKRTLPGFEMSLQQAARQFELYTGEKAPVEEMAKQIKKIYNP